MSFDDLLKHQASFTAGSTSSIGASQGFGGFGGFGHDLDTTNPFADLGGANFSAEPPSFASEPSRGYEAEGLSFGAGYEQELAREQELGTIEQPAEADADQESSAGGGWMGGDDAGIEDYKPAAPASPTAFVIPGPSRESDPNEALGYREEGGFGAPMRLPSPPPGAGVDFGAKGRRRRGSSIGSRGSSDTGFARAPSLAAGRGATEEQRHPQGFFTHRDASPPSSASAGLRTFDGPPTPSTAQTASSAQPPSPSSSVEPVFRPFGVTATLSTSTPEDDSDLVAQSQLSPSSSRPALPDILMGAPESGAGSGMRGLAASTALPAFKASPKKAKAPRKPSVTAGEKEEGKAKDDAAKPKGEEPAAGSHSRSGSSANKPYRPYGLKRAEPKPVVPKEPPAPPAPAAPPATSSPADPPPPAPAASVPSAPLGSAAQAPPSESALSSAFLASPVVAEVAKPTASAPRSSEPLPAPTPASSAPEEAQAPEMDAKLPEDVAPSDAATASAASSAPVATGVDPAPPSSPRKDASSPPQLTSRPSSASITTTSSTTAIKTSVPQSPRSVAGSIAATSTKTTAPPATEEALSAPPPQPQPPAAPATKMEDSDDDERPLASVRKGLIAAAAAAANGSAPPVEAAPEPSAKPEPRYTCAVGDPQKMGSINDIHTVYTVRTKAADPAAGGPLKAQSTVLRRFRDFAWLYEALTTNNPGVIIPPIPDKNLRSRFQTDFIAARRVALEIFLHKTVNHPMLVSDPDLKLFLESDTFSLEIKHRKPDPALQQQGWLSNLGGPRFVEFDDFYDQRRASLDALEHQLRALHLSVVGAAKARLTHAHQLAELGASIVALAGCDLSRPMRQALEHLASLQGRLRGWAEEQARDEEEGLTATIDAYARVCGSVKATFGGRIRAWEKWRLAEQHLRKTQTAWEKVKRQGGGPGVSNVSLAELSDAERKAHDAQNEFEDVSKLIKAEMQRFDKEKVDDFKDAVGRYVDGMLSRQRSIVAAWQEYYQLLQRVGKQNAGGESEGEVENGTGTDQSAGGSSGRPSQEGVNGSTTGTDDMAP